MGGSIGGLGKVIGGATGGALSGLASGGFQGAMQGLLQQSPIFNAINAVGQGSVPGMQVKNENPFEGLAVNPTDFGSRAMTSPDQWTEAGGAGQDTLAGGTGNETPLVNDPANWGGDPAYGPPGYNNLPQLQPLPETQPMQDPAKHVVQTPTGNSLEDMARRAAIAEGIDPDLFIRVGNAEGGFKDPTRRAEYVKNGKREPSYGPYQLLVGGGDTGFPEGMGNQMIRETGLDPRNPANAEAAIRFAAKQARLHGWGQWYGAKAQGIVGKMGIGGNPVPDGYVMPKGTASQSMSRMFGDQYQPGPGEQRMKELKNKPKRGIRLGGGRGVSLQTSSGQADSGSGGAQDDAPEYLASANEKINSMRQGTGASQRKQQRREGLRARTRWEA